MRGSACCGLTTDEQEEQRRLRRENRILREERAILKKGRDLLRVGDRLDPLVGDELVERETEPGQLDLMEVLGGVFGHVCIHLRLPLHPLPK
jgi:hypothetical protein